MTESDSTKFQSDILPDLIDEFAEQLAGGNPSLIDDIAGRYPDHEQEIRKVLNAVDYPPILVPP